MLNIFQDVPLVKFMHLVFTRVPRESYRRRLRSLLLYLCCIFRALLINSQVCGFSKIPVSESLPLSIGTRTTYFNSDPNSHFNFCRHQGRGWTVAKRPAFKLRGKLRVRIPHWLVRSELCIQSLTFAQDYKYMYFWSLLSLCTSVDVQTGWAASSALTCRPGVPMYRSFISFPGLII